MHHIGYYYRKTKTKKEKGHTFSRPNSSQVIAQNILIVLIHDLKPLGLPKFECHFEFLGQCALIKDA